MAAAEPCFQNLSADDAARSVNDFFGAVPWEPTLDPERASAEHYLSALFDSPLSE